MDDEVDNPFGAGWLISEEFYSHAARIGQELDRLCLPTQLSPDKLAPTEQDRPSPLTPSED